MAKRQWRKSRITSIALFPFVTLRKTVEEAGGRVVICNVADIVAKVLTISQLLVESRVSARHLTLASDLDSARQMLETDTGAA